MNIFKEKLIDGFEKVHAKKEKVKQIIHKKLHKVKKVDFEKLISCWYEIGILGAFYNEALFNPRLVVQKEVS